ncbi:MAG: hypothetical protein HFG71_14890 [Hungatella sp.]|nr:hypothetical protein [Hungatella sp.]
MLIHCKEMKKRHWKLYKGIMIVQEVTGEERFIAYAEESLLIIIENYEQKGELDKAIEVAEHGMEISKVIEEKLEELLRKNVLSESLCA